MAVASYAFDLGERWFGWDPADPGPTRPPYSLRRACACPPPAPVPAVARPGKAVAVDPAQVAAVVSPLLRKRVLGPHFGVLVTDLTTGQAGLPGRARTVVTPASTTKLLTSTAALESLGSMARFRTTVRWVPSRRSSCWSAAATRSWPAPRRRPTSATRTRTDVQTLARLTVRKLRTMNVRRVRLAFDDSYFSGPSVNPAWPSTYIPEDVVPPISSLWVDQGQDPTGYGYRLRPGRRRPPRPSAPPCSATG